MPIVKVDISYQNGDLGRREILKNHHIQISMDSKGCYYDNIFVERLWRTVKYEFLYTREFNNLEEVKQNLSIWFEWYNQERFHQA